MVVDHLYVMYLWICGAVHVSMVPGLASSDTYMRQAKEQEMERQSRRSKKQQRGGVVPGKAARRRHRHGNTSAAAAAEDEQDDDIPVMHVVSTTLDAPEVQRLCAAVFMQYLVLA